MPRRLVFAAALTVAASSLHAAEPAPFLQYQLAGKTHTGGAVVIVPAAPFSGSAAGPGPEIAQLARWLNERGLAAFVLRESAPATDATASIAALNRAIRTLRAQAADFKISPKRIAVLGLGRGAEIAADASYNHALEAKSDATDPLEKFSSRPDLLGLIWSGRLPAEGATKMPPTFLAGTSAKTEGGTDLVALWTKLRATRTSVDAHFFSANDPKAGLAADHPSLGTWPEMFFNWTRFNGLLTEEPRLPLKGMVYLDGRALPHGYIILTPVDFVGAGPIIGRVFNSTANAPIGEFIVPAGQGPIAGRYKVDVRQNMNRWLSNGFSGDLVRGTSPAQVTFGHYRRLEPTIEDHKSFTKVRPADKDDYIVEIKPGADANLAMKIEVFSK